MQVTKSFALRFNGKSAENGDVEFQLDEVFVSKATGLPVKGENSFKTTRVKDIPWVEFISSPKIKYDYKAMQEDLEVEKEMSFIAYKYSIEEPRSSQILYKEIMK